MIRKISKNVIVQTIKQRSFYSVLSNIDRITAKMIIQYKGYYLEEVYCYMFY